MYRFNWNTPFILSRHNSRIFYCAGNYVFRSLDRGDDLRKISPEITLTKRGSATSLAESPRDPDLFYAGTDDGALWVTRDGGKEWTEVSKSLGIPAPQWVATIEASRFEAGRVYLALDGHRSDDDQPYLFASEDAGKTWRSLRANLPWGSTRCLREDLKNQDLLFAGTEFGAWFSADRGKAWHKLDTNLPTGAVHAFAFQPQNGEMVAATHGRSLWITDVSALRQIVPENIRDQVVLYKPGAAIRWRNEPSRGRTNRRFAGTNPPSGAQIYYSLPKKAQRVALKIVDIEGATVREFRGVNEPGLQRVSWDLTRAQPRGQRPARGGREGRERSAAAAAGPASPERGSDAAAPPSVVPAQFSAGQPQPAASKGEAESRPAVAVERIPNEAPGSGAPAAQRPGRGRAGTERPGAVRAVLPGTYRVVLNVDGQELAQTIRVEADPNLPPSVAAEEEEVIEGSGGEEEEEEGHWIDD
jgi:hypothetical protein